MISTIAGLTQKDWSEKFWEWLLQTSDEANPLTTVGPARSWRYAGRQPTEFQKQCLEQHGESVWFIAPAPYAEINSVIQTFIPVGTWWLLVAPFIGVSAQEFYPSLDTLEKLRQNVVDVTDTVSELWTIYDGFSVPWYRINNTQSLIPIHNIPIKKTKNILQTDLQKTDGVIQTVQDGYWNFIPPITPGGHLLTIHSKAPTYRVDVTYNIHATGPEL